MTYPVVTIAHCKFLNDTAALRGGALFAADNSRLSILDAAFTGNAAKTADGGGIFIQYCPSMSISNATFTSNYAAYDETCTGGAIYSMEVDTVDINHSVFTSNVSSLGGAIACAGGL